MYTRYSNESYIWGRHIAQYGYLCTALVTSAGKCRKQEDHREWPNTRAVVSVGMDTRFSADMAWTMAISKRGFRDVLSRTTSWLRHDTQLGPTSKVPYRFRLHVCSWLDPRMQARQQCRSSLYETLLGRSEIESLPEGHNWSEFLTPASHQSRSGCGSGLSSITMRDR